MVFILHDILTRGFLSLLLSIHPLDAIMTIDPYILQIPLCAGTASPTKTCGEAGNRAATVSCVWHLCPIFLDFPSTGERGGQVYSVYLQGEIFSCTALFTIKLFFQLSRCQFGGRQRNGNLGEYVIVNLNYLRRKWEKIRGADTKKT